MRRSAGGGNQQLIADLLPERNPTDEANTTPTLPEFEALALDLEPLHAAQEHNSIRLANTTVPRTENR